MSGRYLLAERLKEALPWQIVPDARAIDTVRKPGALVIWSSKRKRLASSGTRWFQDEVTLWVLSGADALHVEDDLDDLLLQVLQVLEPMDEFAWSEAERGILAEKFDGWRIEITCAYELEEELGEE